MATSRAPMRARIDNEYGSRRGLLLHLCSRSALALGRLPRRPRLEGAGVERLVFVCTGNICRSVWAAAQARVLGLEAVSAGLRCAHGHGADPRLAAAARRRGLDLSDHRSRPLTRQPPRAGDLWLGMEPWHLGAMRAHATSARVGLLGAWLSPMRPYLHDPYAASDAYFERCLERIAEAVAKLAAEVRR